MTILDYLLEKSSVAKNLKTEGDVSLNDMLMHYEPDKIDYNIKLLDILPAFENEETPIAKALSTGQLHYSSLKDISLSDLENLCKLVDYLYFPEKLLTKLRNAIDFNKIDPYRWIKLGKHQEGTDKSYVLLCFAALEGYVDCMEWLHKAGVPWNAEVCECAVANLACLKYAHENGCPWTDETMYEAASEGHLESLKYLCENGCPCDESIMSCATSNLECVKYLISQGHVVTTEVFEEAALAGNFDTMVWIDENYPGLCRGYVTCDDAVVDHDNIECLIWMHKNGYSWNEETIDYALVHDSIKCLKYLIENGCPVGPDIMIDAAKHYNVSAMEYLRSRNYSWSENTTRKAAEYASLDCLKYAVENGCPWDMNDCLLAAKSSRINGRRKNETIAWIKMKYIEWIEAQ